MQLFNCCEIGLVQWTKTFQSVTDEVEDFFTERSIPFERAVSVRGASGKDWNVDFAAGPREHSSLVQILSTGSKAAARGIITHVFTAFSDIGTANDRGFPRRIAVFDDNLDIWDPGDYALVQQASDAVARWSRPDELESLLLRQAS